MSKKYVKVLEKKKLGRKKYPYEEEKVPLTIYVRRNKIEELGGRDKIRRMLNDIIT